MVGFHMLDEALEEKSRKKILRKLPKWPTNAVSTNEVIGSARRASAAGSAIDRISNASTSNLSTFLRNPTFLKLNCSKVT